MRQAALWQRIFSGRMLLAFAMGFASGLPLLLTGSTLQAWMREGQLSLSTIGYYTALVGLPYTFKFLWAPLLDRYQLPLGRRRGWMLVTQVALAAGLFALGSADPKLNLHNVALASLVVTFFSATQDIAIDAYRRESLANDELGFGSAMAVNGYRVGMLLAGGGALILADQTSFATMYKLMGGIMLACTAITLLAPEPTVEAPSPRTLQAAVVEPFIEFFKRQGAWLTLLFILLYKLGDMLASSMTTPFYLDLGFSKTEIGAIVKFWGFWATIVGGLVGGALILKFGVARCLVWFGVGQMVSTFGFVWLAKVGHSVPTLASVIAFENFTGGLGTSVFVGCMAALTDRRFTATQYALLSSLMGVPRVVLSAPMGDVAQALGWTNFFVFCTAVALPGLWLALKAKSWLAEVDKTAAS